MDIAIIGSGYVGLVTGACFAELGNSVACVDIDEGKIKKLNAGAMPIYEPQLEDLVKKNVNAKRLEFTTDFDYAVKKSEIIFICVGTPPKANGDADLSYVEGAARRISEISTTPKIIIEKSTVPVETGEKIAEVLQRHNPHNIKFEVVSNPEFLSEGTAVNDFMKPNRIVIGTESVHAQEIMKRLYAPLNAPILFTDIKSAEIIKHASNAFLSTKISFINAVANICELTGADVKKVAEGLGYDERIGKRFLAAGLGYGGFCFPKDAEAFIRIAEKKGYDFALLKEVQKINEMQRKNFIKKIEGALWNLKGKTIAVLGLAFKPDTDDMRYAPSIDIINALLAEGAKIRAFDPKAEENAKKLFGNKIEYCADAYEAAKNSDALLIITEWKEVKEMDLGKIKSAMKAPLIIDGRNIFEKEKMKALGFNYICMGR
ncbi:MAG: UDP-glucose/GDP-mannose dehydrogenase family protein [Candidatus Diapherotrites archaeon]|uniref:UDP-glucose 6-dehydrogenase n=1 Tax=Candidatus Iainarchaeum sp. TaxID=3101447 RepID=A0A8T4KT43_9ARCH|nr:UDP-glucose/GDP-mannose dehydrogenase family protein [Candidatus Diapherotrites archaeon]